MFNLSLRAQVMALLVAVAFWTVGAEASPVQAPTATGQAAIADSLGSTNSLVLAQNRRRQPTLFKFLFKDGKRPTVRRIRPGIIERPRRQTTRKKSRSTKKRSTAGRSSTTKRRTASAPSAIVAIEKSADAKKVLVVGDFMAKALAKGLGDAYAKNKNVVVIDATNGSSGLVRRDYYDWPKSIGGLVEKQSADAIVVVIGSNDRQDLPGARRGSNGWNQAYATRVSEFAAALKATGKPVIWASLVPVKTSSMSKGYSVFNGIYQAKMAEASVPFIDLWNGFSDENGRYVRSGPDVNGQNVRLRTDDGLNFTQAGRRKMAFFVEGELNTILGTGSSTLLASIDASQNITESGPAAAIGPMVPVDAMLAGSSTGLSTLTSLEEAGPQVETIVVQKLSTTDETKPPTGRADNFVWPPQN